MSKHLARNARSQIGLFTRLQVFVRHQSDDLIACMPLDRKPMKLLQRLAYANASPLTCDNTSKRPVQTLKPRNVFNRDPHEGRVGVIEATADEKTGNVLEAVKCEIGMDVAECTDMTETGF